MKFNANFKNENRFSKTSSPKPKSRQLSSEYPKLLINKNAPSEIQNIKTPLLDIKDKKHEPEKNQ